jgi:hypothetical protein
MASNREGFLVLAPAPEGRLLLSRAANPAFCDPYAIGALFRYDGRPGVFLYRDDFFAEPQAPPPHPPVLLLEKGEALPRGVVPGALDREGWETRALRRGADGYWYFRQSGDEKAAFFRARELSGQAGKTSLAAWRDSAVPASLEAAPPPLAALLTAAFAQAGKEAAAALILREGEPCPETFGNGDFVPEEKEPLLLSGFYRGPGPGLRSCVISPQGGGLYVLDGDPIPFSLPSLSGGFRYTAIAPAGNALAVAWEEQEEAAVAAAGFMIIKSPPWE